MGCGVTKAKSVSKRKVDSAMMRAERVHMRMEKCCCLAT